MITKKALVLAGGSVKGAFQAGALVSVFESGFKPDIVYGISAGSMNASYLVNYWGQQARHQEEPDFVGAAKSLTNFWLNNITTPESLGRRRGTYELGLSALRRNFEGLIDTTPLREMLNENLLPANLQHSPIEIRVGAVDIQAGNMKYIDAHTDHYLDYVMASSAIPILMPVVNIGGHKNEAYLDGGLRDVAPLKQAIEDGATEIICIACHTKKMEGGKFPYGNLLALVDRIMDITVNESLNNDIAWAEMYATKNKSENFSLKIIRPTAPLHVDIQSFERKDIARLIEIGRTIAL